MVEYHKHSVHLSENQLRKLARGQTIRLKHEHLHGNHVLYLTEAQIKKLAKAHKNNKGAQLHLSHEQLKEHSIRGGSVFDSLRSFARKFGEIAAPVAQAALPIAQEILQPVIGRVKENAKRKVAEKADELLSSYGMGVKQGKKGDGALSEILGAFGLGVNPHHKKRGRKPRVTHHKAHTEDGKGIFDDILRGVSTVSSAAAPFVPLLAGMGVKGKRGRKPRIEPDGMGLYV